MALWCLICVRHPPNRRRSIGFYTGYNDFFFPLNVLAQPSSPFDISQLKNNLFFHPLPDSRAYCHLPHTQIALEFRIRRCGKMRARLCERHHQMCAAVLHVDGIVNVLKYRQRRAGLPAIDIQAQSVYCFTGTSRQVSKSLLSRCFGFFFLVFLSATSQCSPMAYSELQ